MTTLLFDSLYFLFLIIGFSKLLTCGGTSSESCEVLNLESPETTCQNPPNFPVRVFGAVGGLDLKENPIICAGLQDNLLSNNCFYLENNKWVPSHSLNIERGYAAAEVLQDGQFLLTGGYSDSDYVNSGELLTPRGWESKLPPLPIAVGYHCMATVNSTTVMVIGGYYFQTYSRKTFYFNLGEKSWTEGPELKQTRNSHSCGRIRRDKKGQEMSIVVVGGSSGTSYLSSTEILDLKSNTWQTGPELPLGIKESQLVEDLNGGVVLIGGNSASDSLLNTLYQLPHGGQDAAWTLMDQKMKVGRYLHLSIMVPDNIVHCS